MGTLQAIRASGSSCPAENSESLGEAVVGNANTSLGGAQCCPEQYRTWRSMVVCHHGDMKILLLGGTGFLGRAITTEVLARGHQMICLARGKGEVVDGTVLLRADRHHNDALTPVADRDWDGVIDLTSHPMHAQRAVRDLNTRHWVYVSSSSVYARGDVFEQDESADTLEALGSDVMSDMTQYGSAKVACENVYRDHSASYTIIRSGLIGGDGDHTGRSGYYPWRFAHPTGSDVLVPDPSFPIALIDAKDLSAWVIDCMEQQQIGTFNTTGITTTLAEVLELSREITTSSAAPRVVSNDVLAKFGVVPWMGAKSLPLWVGDPESRYVATLDTSAARKHGLCTRPLRETLTAALEYEEHRSRPRLAGLTDEDERGLRQTL